MNEQPKRARGRPRSFDPDAALERVLEVFWDRGFSAVSMDELAAAAGLNRPNLNAAFGDKRALYLAAITRFRGRLRAGIAAMLQASGPLKSRLLAFYTAAMELYVSGEAGQRGCLVMCTAPAESVRDPEVRQVFADIQAEIEAAMSEAFATARTAGEIGPDADVPALAGLGAAVLQSLALRARAGAARVDLVAFIDGAVGLLAG
jgi:TetR/AcrR family transcriptional regulator, copper-responsive repressor